MTSNSDIRERSLTYSRNHSAGLRALRLCTVALAFAYVALGVPAIASAQNYPSHPVTIVVGFGPSSYVDVLMRYIGRKLQEKLGQPFIIENKAGASGNIGAEVVVRARPDGYTLGAVVDWQWGTAPSIYKDLGFDPVKDFAPISALTDSLVYITVNSSLNVSTFAEFVVLLKANPGKYSYGTIGIGSGHHLMFETVKQKLGLDVVHVPYRGGTQLVPAMVSGEVLIGIMNYPNIRQYVEANQLKVLAVSARRRSPIATEVPTLTELGVEDAEFESGTGLIAPPNTPKPIIDTLDNAVKDLMAEPEVQQQIIGFGGEAKYLGSDGFGARIRADLEKYAKAAKVANLKPE